MTLLLQCNMMQKSCHRIPVFCKVPVQNTDFENFGEAGFSRPARIIVRSHHAQQPSNLVLTRPQAVVQSVNRRISCS